MEGFTNKAKGQCLSHVEGMTSPFFFRCMWFWKKNTDPSDNPRLLKEAHIQQEATMTAPMGDSLPFLQPTPTLLHHKLNSQGYLHMVG
ncbi:uncharacterized protein ACDP82_002137 isoform 2-T3 [Pangshura tecta]